MSDFKNALDSYKKSAGKKTENTGFSAGNISSADRKKTVIRKTLPEHLKKSLSDSDKPEFSRNIENQNTDSSSEMSVAEKYVRQSMPDNSDSGKAFLSNLKKAMGSKSEDNTVYPEKFIFHQFNEKERNKNGNYFIKETGSEDDLSGDRGGASSSPAETAGRKYTESGLKRVAKLIALLGREEAANVLKSFSNEEIEKIASELLKIKQIGRDEASELLKIIHKKNTRTEIFTGGVDRARDILIQAYGKEKGEEILKKSLPEKREKPFEFLNDVEPHQIKLLLKKESRTITAMILTHLDPDKSAALLKEYSAEEQKSIVLKMSHKGKISSEIVEKIENGLKEKIREQGKIVTREVDGKNRLAGILRFMDPEEEERILEELNDEDPDLSREIDSKIFSIEIIHDIPDRDFQKLLNDFSETEIAMILKGRGGKIKKKFAKNMSQQRKEMVHRESELIGIVRKSEVNKVTTEFLDYIRQFEKEGKIIVNRGGNLFV